MIHMVVQWCKYEDRPADTSEYYRLACERYGKETADEETFDQIIPPLSEIRESGSAELNQVVDIILNGAAPGGRAAV